MIESIMNSFDVWTDAQGIKSRTRVKSIDNISLEGIARLRDLILELAVQGKLVEQDSTDDPVSELLKKLKPINEELVKQGKLKKIKTLPVIQESEYPFVLPVGWSFLRLNDIGEWGSGATPNRSNHNYYGGDIPWFKSGELSSDYIDTSEEYITEIALKETSLRYNNPEDVLIAMYGATIGKTSILKVNATTNQAVCACTPFWGIHNTFLLMLLKAYKTRFIDMGAGGAQPNISREKIVNTVIALPPSEEQKRIVSKVDELMLLCDQLENQRTRSLSTHQTLVKTLLETLTQAADADELQLAWEKISLHFDTLFCTEDSIEQLKQTILQLAVMGRLVKQDQGDEPASELLKKIIREKDRLLEEGKIKKEKPLANISEEERPYEIQKGWEWARLQDVTLLITDGKHGDCQNQLNSGYYFLSAKDIKEGKLNYEYGREINFQEFEETHRRTNLLPGDICMVNTGATVGKLAIASDDPKTQQTTFQKSVAVIKPVYGFIYNEYLRIFLLSETEKLKIKSGGSAINNLLLGDLKRKVLPLPPLKEQHSIASKVDELFSVCDLLSEKINITQEIKISLSKTIIENAIT